MAQIKTAISLHKALFEQVETLAREMKVSRSRLFVLAVEDYLRRQQNLQLLEKINQAYPDTSEAIDATERKRFRKMRRAHRKMVEGTW